MNFDPQTFMNTQFGDVSDKVIPIPADEYLGQVEKVDVANGTIGRGERQGEPWVRLDVTFKPLGEKAEQACKAVGLGGVPSVRYGIMLNLDDNGKLKTGDNDNPRLGRLLKALGINGEWMPASLMGQTCTIRIEHETNPETGDQYAQVKGVAPSA
jgi:hypothetical protein